MHGLHDMFYLETKNIYAVILMHLLVGIYLSQCSFSFYADFVTVGYCHKMFHLRCCRVPNPSQYALT